jgi:hypothetical protein
MSAPDQAPLFELGRIVATRGALAVPDRQRIACLTRHACGDFGAIPAQDPLNWYAIKGGRSVMSAYAIDPAKPCDGDGGNTLWIITRGDRSVTTLLLPFEH